MKNGPSPSPLFDEFVKTLPPYGDPRDAEIAALRQQLAECERERDNLKVIVDTREQRLKPVLEENTRLYMQLATVTKERDELVAALLEISQVACSLSPEQKIANEALAKLGADKGEK